MLWTISFLRHFLHRVPHRWGSPWQSQACGEVETGCLTKTGSVAFSDSIVMAREAKVQGVDGKVCPTADIPNPAPTVSQESSLPAPWH